MTCLTQPRFSDEVEAPRPPGTGTRNAAVAPDTAPTSGAE